MIANRNIGARLIVPMMVTVTALASCGHASKTYRVKQGAALIIAVHSRRTDSLGTEHITQTLGGEIMLTNPSGVFTLHPPRSWLPLQSTRTQITVSRPGFQTLQECIQSPPFGGGHISGRVIDLPPARSYAEEKLALWIFKRNLGLKRNVTKGQWALIVKHTQKRESFLRTHYPVEVREDERFEQRRPFHPLPVSPSSKDAPKRTFYHAAPLPDGRTAILGRCPAPETTRSKPPAPASSGQPRALHSSRAPTKPTLKPCLMVLGPTRDVTRSIFLNSEATLGQDLDGSVIIAVGNHIRRLDNENNLVAQTVLTGLSDVSSISGSSKGLLATSDDTVYLFSKTGKLLNKKQIHVKGTLHAIEGPDGAIFVRYQRQTVADIQQIGRFKDNAGYRPGCQLVRFTSWDSSAPVDTVLTGVHTMGIWRGHLWAYMRRAYLPDELPFLRKNFQEDVYHHLLLRLSPDGKVDRLVDITDHRLRKLLPPNMSQRNTDTGILVRLSIFDPVRDNLALAVLPASVLQNAIPATRKTTTPRGGRIYP